MEWCRHCGERIVPCDARWKHDDKNDGVRVSCMYMGGTRAEPAEGCLVVFDDRRGYGPTSFPIGGSIME